MKTRLSKEIIIKYILLATASFSIFIIFLIFAFLFKEGFTAFRQVGWSIFSTNFTKKFGLGGAIVGSLLVTTGALLIAYPLGIGGGIFLSEVAPLWLRRLLKPIIEVLAGIPSVIYGFIGAILLVPFLRDTFDMVSGFSLLAGGIIIGVMTLPIIISISDDSLKAVPRDIKEASLALGATPWVTTKKITFPAASSGIFAAATLGIGKALGETMAVLMVISAITTAPDPWFDVFQSGPTLTSTIAGHMGEAYGLKINVLFAAGVFLFIIVAALSIVSEIMQYRIEK
ncbi:MAG: phosphate ABC transporter permease subunit PstC, partial [Thermodesulfobacteriota bacterium]|nr:phosphate ABC transporter permease subunit PstC [Thermodesulfobacteriota bacterium]